MSEGFDSEDVELMSRALALAWQVLASETIERVDEQAARAALTKAIIAAAEKGERDEQKLASYALVYFRQSQGR